MEEERLKVNAQRERRRRDLTLRSAPDNVPRVSYLVVCLAAIFASGLTLFSGFGLGTLLLPAFAIFFPVDVAIALTAIVHFLNNIFKLVLFGRRADKRVVARFGIPAIPAAILGAALLAYLSRIEPLLAYQLGGRAAEVKPIGLVVGALIVTFALFEVLPALQKLEFERKYLLFGGLLSGFFGGLSGHQGALRSAFLVRAGLSKEAYIGTGVVIACLVDVTRLSVYSAHLTAAHALANWPLLLAATLSAFTGAFLGGRLVKTITMRAIQRLVAAMLFPLALALMIGLV